MRERNVGHGTMCNCGCLSEGIQIRILFLPLLHTRMSSDPSQRNAERKVCCGLKWLRAFFVQFILINPDPDPNFGIIHD